MTFLWRLGRCLVRAVMPVLVNSHVLGGVRGTFSLVTCVRSIVGTASLRGLRGQDLAALAWFCVCRTRSLAVGLGFVPRRLKRTGGGWAGLSGKGRSGMARQQYMWLAPSCEAGRQIAGCVWAACLFWPSSLLIRNPMTGQR